MLGGLFFAVLFKAGSYHPLFLAMTATMKKPLLRALSHLTHVEWTNKKHQLWAKTEDFQQRNIRVDFQVRDHMSREAFPSLIEHLRQKPNSSAFVFVNFRSEVRKCEEKIEPMLIKAKLDIDIITIHGKMEKNDKFAFIKLFTGALCLDKFKPNICITTTAASTGIDKATLDMVLRMGIPRDVVTSFQERGRNARQPGMTGVYAITTDWVMYVKLLLSIVMPLSLPDETSEYRQVNSAISTLAANSQHTPNSPSPLTSTQLYNNTAQAYVDHVDCINLYCLPQLGCVHARSEWIMHCGEMEQQAPQITPCETQCHVCDGSHSKTFLPIIFSGAFAFMKSSAFGAVLGVEINVDNATSFVASLSSDGDWCKRVFGLKNPSTYNVTAFFLQLIGLRIIEFQTLDKKKMIGGLTRLSSGKFKYEDPSSWKGMSFRTANRGGALIAFEKVLENHEKVIELLKEY